MTREEAIKAVGLDLVIEAENKNCDYTNRVTDGTEWAGFTEFSAISSGNQDDQKVACYYYQKNEDVKYNEDLGALTWVVDHYEVF